MANMANTVMFNNTTYGINWTGFEMAAVKYDGSTLLNTSSPEQKQGLSSAKHIVRRTDATLHTKSIPAATVRCTIAFISILSIVTKNNGHCHCVPLPAVFWIATH